MVATESSFSEFANDWNTRGEEARLRAENTMDPYARARLVWRSCAQWEHIVNVYAAIYKKCCEGNVAAQKLWALYTLGKPSGKPAANGHAQSEMVIEQAEQPVTTEQQPAATQAADTANQHTDARTEQREQWKRERKAKRKAIRAKIEKHKNGNKPQKRGNAPKETGQSNPAPLPNGGFDHRPPLETEKTTGGSAAPTGESGPVGDPNGGVTPNER